MCLVPYKTLAIGHAQEWEGGRKGGMEEGRERGREGERERGRETNSKGKKCERKSNIRRDKPAMPATHYFENDASE